MVFFIDFDQVATLARKQYLSRAAKSLFMVSRIPDNFGSKFRHPQIFAVNLSIFGRKGYTTVDF